jgi:hypothetical protein
VKSALPVLAAGGTFAGTVLLGLLAGIWISEGTHEPLWVLGGLVVGLVLGGYGALRLLLRSM